MKNIRFIARLDVKGKNLIKAIHLEGLRVLGDPHEFATKYYHQGADELIYMDTVASLYGRNNLAEIVEKTANNIFIPITVGGGIRSISDANNLLRSGADKVAINTAAVNNPNIIRELAQVFGSQSVVLSVEAKRVSSDKWVVFTDNGREKRDRDVIEWCHYATGLGAGEILLTSIDQEGTECGFDCDLIERVTNAVTVPVIASGGMGCIEHANHVVERGADAVAIASVLHYNKITMQEIKHSAQKHDIRIREVALC